MKRANKKRTCNWQSNRSLNKIKNTLFALIIPRFKRKVEEIMTKAERIINRWSNIPEESHRMALELEKLKLKYISCPYPDKKEMIAIEIEEKKEERRQLQREYENLSELVEVIGVEVAIWLKR